MEIYKKVYNTDCKKNHPPVGVFIAVKFIFAHKILQGNIDERVQYARYEEGPLRISKIDEQVSYQNLLYVTILNLFRSGFKTSPQTQFRCWSKSRRWRDSKYVSYSCGSWGHPFRFKALSNKLTRKICSASILDFSCTNSLYCI